MIHSVHLKGVRGNNVLKKLIERKEDKVLKLITHYGTELTTLKTIIEKISNKRKIYSTKIVLKLPTGTITSKKEGYSSFESVTKAFKTTFNQIKNHIKLLNKKHEWRDESIIVVKESSEKIDAGTNLNENNIFRLIVQNINNYIQYAREEIIIIEEEYNRKINYILPEEIVDNAIIQLFEYSELMVNFEVNLFKLIKENISKNVEDKLSDNGNISLESLYKETLISEDEIFDYYQPDTLWHFDDVISDENINIENFNYEPEFINESLNEFIKTLKPEDTQLFYLYFIKKFSSNDIKEIFRKPLKEIESSIDELRNLIEVNKIELSV